MSMGKQKGRFHLSCEHILRFSFCLPLYLLSFNVLLYIWVAGVRMSYPYCIVRSLLH